MGRGVMVSAASVVVAVGTATGLLSALDDRGGSDEARPGLVSGSQSPDSLPVVPSASGRPRPPPPSRPRRR